MRCEGKKGGGQFLLCAERTMSAEAHLLLVDAEISWSEVDEEEQTADDGCGGGEARRGSVSEPRRNKGATRETTYRASGRSRTCGTEGIKSALAPGNVARPARPRRGLT